MAESSFPVLEQPLTDQQWGQVTAGIGSGVLGGADGNYAYQAVSNAANTAQLSAGSSMAQAIVAGFYHRIDANHTISLPAISSGTRTYYVGLTYDPTKHASPSGPVSVTVTTSRPSGGGKVYLPLYEVVRQANQLLSDATVRVRRVLISPTLAVASVEEMPLASTMMQGTMCQTTNLNMLWRVSGDRWVPVGSTDIASPFSMSGWNVVIPSGGIELSYLADGRRLAKVTDAQAVRTGTQFTQGTGFQAMGTFIPPAYRGVAASQSQAMLATGNAVYQGAVRLDASSGVLQFRLGAGTQTIMRNHVILFSASWVVA